MSRLANWQLFAICVLVWGTTWHAITYQLDAFAPEIGVALRYALAGTTVLGLARWQGLRLAFAPSLHALFALQGVFMYGLAYITVYHAERFVPSGLVAVGYSASPLLGGVGAALLFGHALGARFIVGGLLALLGVAVIFAPEIARAGAGEHAALGAALTVASVLLSAVGALAASRNSSRGVAMLSAMGWSMLYGALAAVVVAWALDRPFTLASSRPSAWVAVAYLAWAGSVLAFACFLTLQDRIGPGRASVTGVMTPLFAIVVSVAFEGYRPGWATALGAALAVAGNALMLRPAPIGRAAASPAGAAAAE